MEEKLPRVQLDLLDLLFSYSSNVVTSAEGKNTILGSQDLWFSSYVRVWRMRQCLVLVITEN